MIFQRVVIATMQAFRQRAVKGDFPEKDPETGEKIDYGELFESGPARLWTLPPEAEMWESTPPSFQDILASVKDDTRDLASQTYTPMTYFSNAENASAEGAQIQHQNYLGKVSDRRRRFGSGLERHISIYFEVIGDTERADVSRVEIIWDPLQMSTLTEQVSAFTSLKGSGMAFSTAARYALGMTPKEIRRAENERIQETLTAQLTESMNQTTPLQKSSFGATAEAKTAERTSTSSVSGTKGVSNTSSTAGQNRG